MEFLKALFESGAITWEQFSKEVTDKGYKLADLSTGNYVSKKKYTDDLESRDTTIADLNTQITTRDGDLADLQSQLANADTTNATKIKAINDQLSKLQGEYGTVKTEYESRLEKQAFEFAVKEFASEKKFTSNAAKRDFINEMLKNKIEMKDGNLVHPEDFVKSYSEANKDALVVETEPEAKGPNAFEAKPVFVQPTAPAQTPNDNGFMSAFNFQGVRPKETK